MPESIPGGDDTGLYHMKYLTRRLGRWRRCVGGHRSARGAFPPRHGSLCEQAKQKISLEPHQEPLL